MGLLVVTFLVNHIIVSVCFFFLRNTEEEIKDLLELPPRKRYILLLGWGF